MPPASQTAAIMESAALSRVQVESPVFELKPYTVSPVRVVMLAPYKR